MSDEQLEIIDDGDSYEQFCSICGGYMDYVECWHCGGDGYFELYEDDPMWYEPGDMEICYVCSGTGGYWECASLPHEDGQS